MSDSGSDIDANWNISIGLSPYSADGTLKARKQGETVAQKLMFAPKAVASNAASMKVAKVLKQESSEKNAFLGYNVYMNGDKLNESMIQGNAYTDNSDTKANYLEYQVAAVYSKTGEKFSNKVTLMTTGINGVESQQLKVEIAGNTLRIIGAHTGDKIAVYAADGKLLINDVVEDSYIQNVSLSRLTAGTYIVKVGKETVKVRVSRR